MPTRWKTASTCCVLTSSVKSDSGQRTLRPLIYFFITALTVALCVVQYLRGGPYFARAETVFSHPRPGQIDGADAIVLCQRVVKMIPRGASVTCVRPIGGVTRSEYSNFLIAAGMLPRQNVVLPEYAGLATPPEQACEYVIAIRDPLEHPRYALVAEWPEGRLYHRHQ